MSTAETPGHVLTNMTGNAALTQPPGRVWDRVPNSGRACHGRGRPKLQERRPLGVPEASRRKTYTALCRVAAARR